MIIKNAKVYDENGSFTEKEIYIQEDKFTEEAQGEVIDGKGMLALPGLIDIHFHGCMGKDFCDGNIEAIQTMAEYELANGITSIAPATMTLSEEELMKISKAAKEYSGETGAELLGINMEGPFINTKKKGAQNPTFIHKPDIAMFRRLQEASGGLFKLVDIAPEEEGAMEFIDALKEEVVISVAHTNADYKTALEAFHRGAKHVTHLYNAMPAYTHREPGVIGAASDSSCMVELICDGVHIHPAVIRNTFRIFGKDRVVFISDSMMATGMEDGEYALGGQAVKVEGNRATLVVDGTIAGSATNLFNCMKFAVQKAGIPLENAVKCVTENPAKVIGVFDRYGSITPGKYADFILVDEALNIKHIFKKGTVVKGI
ncbi:MAG: N-acetylglucosamine-6-phosphate deacetylase [Acetivibrio sp.]